MIDLDVGQITALVMGFFWPFIRILSFIAVAPILSNTALPQRFKVGLAFILAIIVQPTINEVPTISPMSYPGLLLIIQQTLIGLAIGFSMRIVFVAIEAAGAFAGLQMGLGFATFYDEASGTDTVILARILNAFIILMFLAFNGHVYMIMALAESFNSIPIALNADALTAEVWQTIAGWGSIIFSTGARIAMPLVAGVLTLQLSMGILNRTAPQFHIFSIGFPMKIIGGLTMLSMITLRFDDIFGNLFSLGFGVIYQLMQLMSTGSIGQP